MIGGGVEVDDGNSVEQRIAKYMTFVFSRRSRRSLHNDSVGKERS
jgi:hypothetical protein